MRIGNRESGLGIGNGRSVRAELIGLYAAVVNGREGTNQSPIPNAQSRHLLGGAQ